MLIKRNKIGKLGFHAIKLFSFEMELASFVYHRQREETLCLIIFFVTAYGQGFCGIACETLWHSTGSCVIQL